MKWEELFSGKCFISDLGEAQTIENGNEKIILAQYAAWAPIIGSKSHQIVEISHDLTVLMQKYHVPADRICTLIQD